MSYAELLVGILRIAPARAAGTSIRSGRRAPADANEGRAPGESFAWTQNVLVLTSRR